MKTIEDILKNVSLRGQWTCGNVDPNDAYRFTQADAEFLSRAASNFEPLVRALEEAAEKLDEVRTGDDFECESWEVARKARCALAEALKD